MIANFAPTTTPYAGLNIARAIARYCTRYCTPLATIKNRNTLIHSELNDFQPSGYQALLHAKRTQTHVSMHAKRTLAHCGSGRPNP
jgi:hypothetical protein